MAHVLRIEPAASCNLRCAHCPTGRGEGRRGLMADATFDRLAAAVAAAPGRFRVAVLYHGGEPLLHPDLAAMVRRLKELGVPFAKTVTNGMLLDARRARELVAAGLDALEVSLDGAGPGENDAIRRGGDAARVIANVRALLGARAGAAHPRLFIATTQFVRGDLPPAAAPPVPPWLERELGAAGGDVEGYKTTWAVAWPDLDTDAAGFDVVPAAATARPVTACDHLESTVTVRWNGDVVPCCYDLASRAVLGNVREAPLAEILAGRRARALRAELGAGRPPGLCRRCPVLGRAAYLRPRAAPAAAAAGEGR